MSKAGGMAERRYENVVGRDLYLDPWWALENVLSEDAKILTDRLTERLGEPDLWFNNAFHVLLWGPRPIHRSWRPSFHANRTDVVGKLWVKFWLPWRAGRWGDGPLNERGLPYGANLLQEDVMLPEDLEALERYVQIAPYIEKIYSGGF